jgi:hypothetical protein
MRPAVAAIGALVIAAGIANALPISMEPSRLLLRPVDTKTGAPIDGVIVSASEHYYWTGFHSSGETCFRAATQVLNGAAPFVLPAAKADSAPQMVEDTRHVEILAYRRGYCALQPYASAHQAGFVKFAGKNDPHGGWGSVESPKFDQPIVLSLKPSIDPPRHRARHLALVARVAASQCRALEAAFAPMKDAILGEAREIARNGGIHERLFALRAEEAFNEAPGKRAVLGTVLHEPAERGDVPTLMKMLDWGRSEAYAAQPNCLSNRHYCLFPSGFQSGAPVTEPFRIDAADERGFTALMAAAHAMQPATARILLENGADVNAVDEPGGYSALDLVLSRAREDLKETTPEGIDGHLLRMIDLLKAATPALTVNARYHAELADRASWKLGTRLTSFWESVRERVLPLTPRPDQPAACPIERILKESLRLTADK